MGSQLSTRTEEQLQREINELKSKNFQLQLDLAVKESDIIVLQREEQQLTQRYKKQEGKLTKLKEALLAIFNDDQIRALTVSSTRGQPWSDSTMTKALQLRLACGATGYKLLLKQGMPLPSSRTLQRSRVRLQDAEAHIPQAQSTDLQHD